jgi:hypothetical protein
MWMNGFTGKGEADLGRSFIPRLELTVRMYCRHVFEGEGWKSLDVALLQSPHLVQVPRRSCPHSS